MRGFYNNVFFVARKKREKIRNLSVFFDKTGNDGFVFKKTDEKIGKIFGQNAALFCLTRDMKSR